MSIPKFTFADNVQLVNLGDLHRGDDGCDVAALHRTIRYIRQHDNCLWYSTGDMMNNALKMSKSDVYSSMSPEKEMETLQKELAQIAGKCLGMTASNHHRRTKEQVGLNLDKIFAMKVGIPYIGKMGLICVKVGAACYYVAMHHGCGGGKRRGGKINSLEDLAALIPGADVYSEGHTHSYATFQNEVPYIDRKRNSLQRLPATFVTTGHYLEWNNSYAQDYKMRPMPIGSSVLELFANEGGQKRVKVDFIC